MKIKKISKDKYQITTQQEPIVEEVSVGDLEGQIRLLKSDKELFENNNKSITEMYNSFDLKIEKIQNKIEELKKVK